jgi:tape measure domain-containing protein
MNNAEVLIKFKGDTSQDQIKQEEEKLKSLEKTGKVAMAGLTTAVDLAVGKLISMGIEYNGQVETYLTRLKTLTGSSEKAGQILEQIKKDALSTPFEVSGLVQGQSLLLSTGLSAEQARQDILNLGNAISASGGGNAELQRMAVNLQQIKNVGKASALDIKQFAYAGIDIYGLLADSMGITRKEASELDVTYEMLSEALAKASGEGGRYAGAMEAQSKTYKGAMSNLQESFQVLTGELSEGLFNAIKDLIPSLTSMFDWLSKNKDIVLAIAIPLLTFINIITGFLIIQKIIGLFSALWAVLMANPIIAIIALIMALVAGFMYLWNNCEGFRNFFIGIWEAIKSAVQVGVDFIVSCFNAIVEFVKAVGIVLYTIFIKPYVDFFNLLKSIFSNVLNAVKDLINKIKNFFGELPNNLLNVGKNMITGLINGIKGMKDKAVNAVKDVGKNLLNGIKGVLGIHSPSTEFGIVGKYSVLGYTEALDSMQDDVDKAINSTFGLSPNLTNSAMLHYSPNVVVNNEVNVSQDPLGQMVSNIKSFSGGAKNDYNFGLGN